MRSFFARLLPVALFALGAACSQEVEGDDAAVGSDQHLTEATPIPPATWATCWFESNGSNDAFFLAYTMTCSGPDPKYPLPAQVLVSGLDNTNTQSVNGELDASDKRVGAVYGSKLPLDLELAIILRPNKDSGWISELNPDDFRFNQKIDHPETITKDHPLVVTQPFALWKLEIVQKTSRYVILPDGAKGLSTAPFVAGFTDGTTYDVSNAPVNNAADGNAVSVLLFAPKDGKLGVRYVSAEADKRVLLDSPGTWVAGDDDLTKQSDGDPPPGPAEPAKNDAGPEQDAAPANPPGPPPTCGVPGLACCPGEACSDGSYCKYQSNGSQACTSCGAPGQDCCPGQTCGDASYCKYQSNGAQACTSCGAPGQDCCPGQTCGDASYCKYQSNGAQACTSCGAAGQDCCPGQTCSGSLTCGYGANGTMSCK